MSGQVGRRWWGVVLDSSDPRGLADFYVRLLGWQVGTDEPEWMTVTAPEGRAYLGFQLSPDHVPPVWPPADGRQQMQVHLDLQVDDLDGAVAHALEVGARQAGYQPQDHVRVMLDPAGHPFCLYRGD